MNRYQLGAAGELFTGGSGTGARVPEPAGADAERFVPTLLRHAIRARVSIDTGDFASVTCRMEI
jgi:hypothetical protein